MKKFNQFISESNSDNCLYFYAFDWDNNILIMPTVILMEKLIGNKWIKKNISTEKYSEIKNNKDWRFVDNDPQKTFIEFGDNGINGSDAFLIDTKKAINDKKYGPSWSDFKECLINGSIFFIITARGHESDSIKRGIEWIIDNELSKDELYTMYNNLLKFEYLFKKNTDKYDKFITGIPSENILIKKYINKCYFIGVSAPSLGNNVENIERLKGEFLLKFKNKINSFGKRIGMCVKLGFSDDDHDNIKHIEDLISNINKEEFPHIIEYVVKNTKNPDDIKKSVSKLNETSHQTPGKESSVLPFTQFNNMTNKLYPSGELNRQDDFANQLRRETEYIAKISKELLDKRRKANKEDEKSDEKNNKSDS